MTKKIYKKAALAAAVFLSATSAQAQYNMGALSNWNTFNSLYLNPASIADSREWLSVNVFTLNAGIDNNLGYMKGGIIKSVMDGEAKFNYSNSKQSSAVAPYAEVRLPGVIWNITSRHSVGVTTGVRGMNQFSNFDQSLYRIVTDPDYVSTNDIDATSRRFNYTAHLWSEIGLSYAGVILDDPIHQIRGGATVRYLGGIGYIGLKGKNLDAHFRDGNDSFYADNSDIEYGSNVLSTRSALVNGFNNNSVINEFFGEKSGMGIGGDIGFIYDYCPNADRRTFNIDGRKGLRDGSFNRYLLRVSASVVDIGSIKYNADDNSNARVSGDGYLTGQGLRDNVSNFDDFRNYVVASGFRADTIRRATRVYMPTRLILGVDYHAYRNWYVNTQFVHNLADRTNFGTSYYDVITITPRYDSRLWSVGMPISWNTLGKTPRVGIGGRFTGFFIGSDDILALFSSNQYGFNCYVGGYVPLNKKRITDRDADGVSDRKDECPDDYGTWENRGCPVDKDDADGKGEKESDNKED